MSGGQGWLRTWTNDTMIGNPQPQKQGAVNEDKKTSEKKECCSSHSLRSRPTEDVSRWQVFFPGDTCTTRKNTKNFPLLDVKSIHTHTHTHTHTTPYTSSLIFAVVGGYRRLGRIQVSTNVIWCECMLGFRHRPQSVSKPDRIRVNDIDGRVPEDCRVPDTRRPFV